MIWKALQTLLIKSTPIMCLAIFVGGCQQGSTNNEDGSVFDSELDLQVLDGKTEDAESEQNTTNEQESPIGSEEAILIDSEEASFDEEPQKCFSTTDRQWRYFDIDFIGGAPIYPEVKLDPLGRPVAVFRKGNAGERYPVLSVFNGEEWSSPEIIERQPDQYLGKRPSLAISRSQEIFVTAYDEFGMQLRLMRQKPGEDWTSETLYEQAKDAGDHSCLLFDDKGMLHLSFLEYDGYRLIYARLVEEQWSFEVVSDSNGPVKGSSSGLAVGSDGSVHLSFYTHSHLHYGIKKDGQWTIEPVDETGDQVGLYSNLRLDQKGRPHIAYLNWSDEKSEIRYATKKENEWQIDVVDEGLGISYTTGIVLSSCDEVFVAYARNQGEGTGGLWLANRLPEETVWQRAIVDSQIYVSGIDMVLYNDDKLHIIYLDETNTILKHAMLE